MVVLEAAVVVFHLLHEPFVAILAAKILHDLLAEGFLLGAQIVDRRLDDVPVVADPLPQRMVEREADHFSLFGRHRLVESCDGGLGSCRSGWAHLGWSAAAAVLPIKGTAPASAPMPPP